MYSALSTKRESPMPPTPEIIAADVEIVRPGNCIGTGAALESAPTERLDHEVKRLCREYLAAGHSAPKGTFAAAYFGFRRAAQSQTKAA